MIFLGRYDNSEAIINGYYCKFKTIISKKNTLMYTRTFILIYHWRYEKQVHEIYGMVKLQKYSISRVENFLNLGSHQFYKVYEVFQNAYIIIRNTKNNTFHFNHYINWRSNPSTI